MACSRTSRNLSILGIGDCDVSSSLAAITMSAVLWESKVEWGDTANMEIYCEMLLSVD
jgi:hypothetical protein